MTQPRRHDVCVAGGGPAGATVAAILAGAGIDVVLIGDGASRRGPREVVAPGALRAAAGARLDWAASCRGARCRGVLSRWSGDDAHFTDYELLECQHAVIVDRAVFDADLAAFARAAGATIAEPCHVRAARRDHDRWRWRVADAAGLQPPIEARVLVDATGRTGRLVPDMPHREPSDASVAVWARVNVPLIDPTMLVVDRSAGGWWYGVASGEATDLVFVTDADDVAGASAEARGERLQTEFAAATLLAAQLDGEPSFAHVQSKDARMHARVIAAGDDWIAVGDTVLALDPLSGQGLRLAVDSAIRAAAAVAGRLDGDAMAAAPYGDWCCEQVAAARVAHQTAYRHGPAGAGGAFWTRRVSGAPESSAPRGASGGGS